MKKYFNESLVVLSTILWGIIGLFSKPIIEMGFSSFELVFLRTITSALILGIIIFIKDENLFKIKLKDLALFVLAGSFGFAFCVFCYMGSMVDNGVGMAVMLMYTSPVWTLIISCFVFKEKVSFNKICALTLIITGCVMLCIGENNIISFKGVLLGVGSGIGLALLNILSKILVNKKYSPLTSQFYIFCFAALTSLPFSKITNMSNMILINDDCIWIILCISLLCTVIPYILYTVALKNISASTAGMLSCLEVVFGMFTGCVFFNEKIGFWGIVGVVSMLLATFLLSIKNNKS